ncbi:hypothetical protein ACFYOY_35780 [Streptomyces sp. NPDC007875]|uniref:hypothetical protein n=1 Tax=Streptomyces sp. NPDC007875 TaxID=3364783 RepID=UPI00369F4F06
MSTEQGRLTLTPSTADRVCALATPPATAPTNDHAAVWLDDEGGVWADYPTVPSADDVLPMVWHDESPTARGELEERGYTLTRIAHCRTELLSPYGAPSADGAAEYAAVWLDDAGTVWADYPTDSEEGRVLPLVWGREEAEPRSELEELGYEFTLIGWSF